jgi:hypothetical protein
MADQDAVLAELERRYGDLRSRPASRFGKTDWITDLSYEDSLDALRDAIAHIRSLAAAPQEPDELAILKRLVEETIMVAKTDEDADGFISAYHFQTGAIHRLLAAVRTGNYPPHVRQATYEYQKRASYTPADPAEIAAYEERVQREVIPEIMEQQRRKHGHKAAPQAESADALRGEFEAWWKEWEPTKDGTIGGPSLRTTAYCAWRAVRARRSLSTTSPPAIAEAERQDAQRYRWIRASIFKNNWAAFDAPIDAAMSADQTQKEEGK